MKKTIQTTMKIIEFKKKTTDSYRTLEEIIYNFLKVKPMTKKEIYQKLKNEGYIYRLSSIPSTISKLNKKLKNEKIIRQKRHYYLIKCN